MNRDATESTANPADRPTRREFLAVGGATAAVAWAAAEEFNALVNPPTFVVRLLRDRDLLNVELAFINFREKDDHLLAVHGNRSFVAVHFPAQNLGEAIFEERHVLKSEFEVDPLPEKDDNIHGNSPTPPVRSYMSGPSRLVFVAPEGTRLPLRNAPEGAVDFWFNQMAGWPLRIAPEAAIGKSTPRPPRHDETMLEIPYRLGISPSSSDTRWLTSSERMPFDPPTGGVSELWNAQLFSRTKVVPAQPPAGVVRGDANLAPLADATLHAKAVWSPDWQARGEPDTNAYFPGLQPLSLRKITRHLLVEQMRNGNGWIDVDHLILTALGSDAFLTYFNQMGFEEIIEKQLKEFHEFKGDPKGDDAPTSTTLMVWKHQMVIGRDVYFVEAFFGVLFPMQYPSIFVEVTRRQFASKLISKKDEKPIRTGPPGAYLLKKRYIVVRRHDRDFADSKMGLGCAMPAKTVVLGMTQTPDLADPSDPRYDIVADVREADRKQFEGHKGFLFVPREANAVGGPRVLRWPMTFTDTSGRQSKTDQACLLFASHVILGHNAWQALKNEYTEWAMPSQPMALAPEIPYLKEFDAGKDYELPRDERESAGRLGDALQTWHSAAVAVDGELEALFKKTILGKPFEELSKRLAALEAVKRELGIPWKEDIEPRLTFPRFLRDTVLEATGDPLAKLEDALKKEKARFEGEIGAMVDRIRATQRQQEATIRGFGETTKDKLLKKLKGMDPDTKLKDFHEQLRQAEKVASLLETRMIKFGSRLVDGLLRPGGVAEEIVKQWPQNPDVDKFLDAAVTELKKLQAPKIVNEYKKLVEGMLGEIDALRKTKDDKEAAVKAWKEQLDQVRGKAVAAGFHQFHAVMEEVRGVIPSMKTILPDYPAERITLLPAYLAKGIQRVEQGIFAQVDRTEKELQAVKKLLEKSADGIKNGLATPRTIIQGMSSRLGAVAAESKEQLVKIAENAINEFDFKKAIPNTKLFGTLELMDLIGKIGKGEMPNINQVKLPGEQRHVWKWTIPIKNLKLGIVEFKSYPGNSLHIEIVTTARLPQANEAIAGKGPEGSVKLDAYLGRWDKRADRPNPPTGTFKDGAEADSSSFSITILGMVGLYFRKVRLEAQYALGGSASPSVKPEMASVEFLGPLKFIKKLQEKIGNLGGGFKLSLTPSYLELSFGFLVPPITCGAFCMRNLRLGAGLMLPFGDDPLRFSFNFSSFAAPFEVTVMCFGGRGYLRIEIDTKGGRLLEGALEFGGALSFDVGVASGGLYVMAGFYFRITQSQTALGGYFRAGGTLDVLGLIHVSVEFMLSVSYRVTTENGLRKSELYGTATLTISIEMLFFSISVNVSMEKRIAGSEEPVTMMAGRAPQFIALRAEAAEDAPADVTPPLPVAYFERTASKTQGRFAFDPKHPHESTRAWREELWLQFDF